MRIIINWNILHLVNSVEIRKILCFCGFIYLIIFFLFGFGPSKKLISEDQTQLVTHHVKVSIYFNLDQTWRVGRKANGFGTLTQVALKRIFSKLLWLPISHISTCTNSLGVCLVMLFLNYKSWILQNVNINYEFHEMYK